MSRSTRQLSRLVLAIVGSCCVMAGCGGSSDTSAPPPPPPPPSVAAVEITLASRTLESGGTVQLTAVAKDAAGAMLDGRTFTWSSSAPTVATVSAQGLVQGVAQGKATITASTAGKTANVELTVRDTAALGTTLSGTIERLRVTFAEGRVYRVTGDLTVIADSALDVRGKLELEPGVKLVLVTGGTLDVSGEVVSVPAASMRVGAIARGQGSAATGPSDATFVGQRVNVSGRVVPDGNVFISGVDTGPTAFSIVTIGQQAIVWPQRAPDGTRASKDGALGYSVEIGTSTASSQFAGTVKTGRIRRLRVLQSIVKGGGGGHGYNLRRPDGSVSANIWTGTGGNGGKGGKVDIFVEELEVRVSEIASGSGGFAGSADLRGPDKLLDGTGPAGDGESLTLNTGVAGSSGDMRVAANTVVAADYFSEGAPGSVASMQVAGGNGKAGGPGGDFLIFVSDPGARGNTSVSPGISVDPPVAIAAPMVELSDAANGAGSVSPSKAGGRGGAVTISGPVIGLPPRISQVKSDGVAKGGLGWNGCLVSPYTLGTDGGAGGTLKATGAMTTTKPLDVSGGDGGDGWSAPGRGGTGGALVRAGGTSAGTKGADGKPCPVVSVQPQSILKVYDAPTGPCQPPQNPSGSVTIRGLVSAPTSFTGVIVNLQGASGIGLLPNQSTNGSGVGSVMGIAPPGGVYTIWYNFDPCTALAGGGDFRSEIRITTQAGTQSFVVPITGTVR